MKKRILFPLVFGTPACAGRAEARKATHMDPIHKPPTGSGAAGPVEIRLTKDGGSKSVALAKGRTLIVVIVGNPSTGYQWELAGSVEEAILSQERSVEFVAGASDLVGAPGEYRFTFKTMGLGRIAIGLKCVRPWEKDAPPVAIATVNVTVTP